MNRSTLALVFSSLLLGACGDLGLGPLPSTKHPPDAASAPATAAPDLDAGTDAEAAPPPKRTMVTAPAAVTAPENLVHDPELAGALTNMDAPDPLDPFSIIIADGTSVALRFDATTPVGPSMPVLYVQRSDGAPEVSLYVTGGGGPIDASVWLGVVSGKRPTHVLLASLLDWVGLDLVPDETSTVQHGAVQWTRFVGHTAEAMPGLLFLTVSVPSGSDFGILAPDVIGHAAPSPRIGRLRPLSPTERARTGALHQRQIRRLAGTPTSAKRAGTLPIR